MRAIVRAFIGIVLLVGWPDVSTARPERIRPGVSYYSDACVETGPTYDIEKEMNFEEVYQLYRYCEVIYDAQGRVTHFREYERGELLREERYTYGDAGQVVSKEIRRPGSPPETHPLGEGKTQP